MSGWKKTAPGSGGYFEQTVAAGESFVIGVPPGQHPTMTVKPASGATGQVLVSTKFGVDPFEIDAGDFNDCGAGELTELTDFYIFGSVSALKLTAADASVTFRGVL